MGWAGGGVGGCEFSAVDLKTQPGADWRIPAAAALVIGVVLELGTNLRVFVRGSLCADQGQRGLWYLIQDLPLPEAYGKQMSRRSGTEHRMEVTQRGAVWHRRHGGKAPAQPARPAPLLASVLCAEPAAQTASRERAV